MSKHLKQEIVYQHDSVWMWKVHYSVLTVIYDIYVADFWFALKLDESFGDEASVEKKGKKRKKKDSEEKRKKKKSKKPKRYEDDEVKCLLFVRLVCNVE